MVGVKGVGVRGQGDKGVEVKGIVLIVVYKAADEVLCTFLGGKTIKNFIL
jgi:hypothetical protein